MRTASVNEFRARLATMMSSDEPVMVTRHGKVTGFYLPWVEEDVPLQLKREAFKKYRKELDNVFESVDVDEKELMEDFAKFRKNRRRRR